MPDGHRLTDPEHATLLESTKDFIWSLFAEPVEGRKRPTMNTLRNKTSAIKPLLRWMVSLGISRFSDLAGHTLHYVPLAKHGTNGQPVVPMLLTQRLIIVEDLYWQRDKLRDGLLVHPWPHEVAGSLAGTMRGDYCKPKTALIPDAVASSLAEAALDYVQNRSMKILATLEIARNAVEEKIAAGGGKHSESKARIAIARKSGFEGANDLTKEGKFLRTACYIIIGMFTGMRESEMLSIAENCLVPARSRDDSTDILWLHGTIYKTGIRRHRWLVPTVPLPEAW